LAQLLVGLDVGAIEFAIIVAAPNSPFRSSLWHFENSLSHAARFMPGGFTGNGSSKLPLPPKLRRILTALSIARSPVVCRMEG
jgi:hypothetical protein